MLSFGRQPRSGIPLGAHCWLLQLARGLCAKVMCKNNLGLCHMPSRRNLTQLGAGAERGGHPGSRQCAAGRRPACRAVQRVQQLLGHAWTWVGMGRGAQCNRTTLAGLHAARQEGPGGGDRPSSAAGCIACSRARGQHRQPDLPGDTGGCGRWRGAQLHVRGDVLPEPGVQRAYG